MNAKNNELQQFSFAKLVFYALGAGVLVLVVTLPIVIGLARSHPTAALCVAIGGVLLMVVVIALVSKKMMSGVQREIDRRRAEIAAQQRDGGAEN